MMEQDQAVSNPSLLNEMLKRHVGGESGLKPNKVKIKMTLTPRKGMSGSSAHFPTSGAPNKAARGGVRAIPKGRF